MRGPILTTSPFRRRSADENENVANGYPAIVKLESGIDKIRPLAGAGIAADCGRQHAAVNMLYTPAVIVKPELIATDAPPRAVKAELKAESMVPEADDGGERNAADDEAMEQDDCKAGQAGAEPALEDDYDAEIDAEADDDNNDDFDMGHTVAAAVGEHARAGAGKPALPPLPAVELAPIVDVELPADEEEARRYMDRAFIGFSHLLSDVPAACIIIGKDLRPASVCVSSLQLVCCVLSSHCCHAELEAFGRLPRSAFHGSMVSENAQISFV
jgi:hypothetical protein